MNCCAHQPPALRAGAEHSNAALNITYKRSCLCGQVQFEISGFGAIAAHCHCSMCRKFHGAAFASLADVTGLKWLAGASLLQDYNAPNGTIRSFCSHCGSSLGFRTTGQTREQMEIALVCFDEPIPVSIDSHIYTNYKADWYDITDGLPRHGEGRSS